MTRRFVSWMLLIFLMVGITLWPSPKSAVAGFRNDKEFATVNEFPSVALITLVPENLNDFSVIHCQGVIVSNRDILTSAKCMNSYYPANPRMRSRTVYVGFPGSTFSQSSKIMGITYAPNWQTWDQPDIAIVTVSMPFRFNQAVQPISVYKQNNVYSTTQFHKYIYLQRMRMYPQDIYDTRLKCIPVKQSVSMEYSYICNFFKFIKNTVCASQLQAESPVTSMGFLYKNINGIWYLTGINTYASYGDMRYFTRIDAYYWWIKARIS